MGLQKRKSPAGAGLKPHKYQPHNYNPGVQGDKQRQRGMLEQERLVEKLVIRIAQESIYRCEYLSDEELARFWLAQKRIDSIDRQLAELNIVDMGR